MDSRVSAITQAGDTLDEASVGRFRAELHGRLIRPGDADYDDARRVYNAMIDKRPALIARCADAADVRAAVNFGRDHGLPLSLIHISEPTRPY